MKLTSVTSSSRVISPRITSRTYIHRRVKSLKEVVFRKIWLSFLVLILVLSPITAIVVKQFRADAATPILATDVIGQSGGELESVFTTAGVNNRNSRDGFISNSGPSIDTVNHRLFVTDNSNNRVLVFNLDSNNLLLDRVADNVLGQPNFSSSSSATTQSGMEGPVGVTFDSTVNRLFVADSNNNRVLVYDTTTVTNGENAVNVLGQPDFISYALNTTQSGMNNPIGISLDESNNRLFVADTYNHRILVYDTTAITNGENAVNVLGQPDFTSSSVATTQSGMNSPRMATFDPTNNKLFVTDTNNNRVLVFNTTAITDGENSVNVLGQPDFVSGGSDTNQSSLNFPWSTAFDSTNNRLFVVDKNNARILIFDIATITDGENSVNVLGQPDFDSGGGDTTQSRLNNPFGATFDLTNNRLFVADSGNNRVIVFDTTSITNGENAVDLLGQTDGIDPIFTTSNQFNDNLSKTGFNSTAGSAMDSVNHRLFVTDSNNSRILVFNLDSNNLLGDRVADNVLGQPDFISNSNTTTQSGMNYPRGVTFDSTNNRLFVADTDNNRILVFDTTAITNGENAVNVLGQPDFVSNSNATTQSGMEGPQGVTFDSTNNRLFVTDRFNARVLVFDTTTITNGENAVNVLGQTDFVSGNGVTTQSRLNSPFDATFDSTNNRLFVADADNNRVLVFDTTAITDGENAVNVLGQPDFVSNSTATTQSRMNYPQGVTFDSANNRLFVADSSNNRILLFDIDAPTPTNITAYTATDLLGQLDENLEPIYTTVGTDDPPNQTGFNLSSSGSLTLDLVNHKLFVADTGNHRILVFNLDSNNVLEDREADNVLGQPNFTSDASTVTQSGMYSPRGIAFDSANNRLFVAESNNRVLVFDTTVITNGENAVNVLGQTDFISSGYATTQSGMYAPRGVTFDSTNNRLFVADTNNCRVLVFDTTTITDGENAVNVLGQPDFISSSESLTQSRMSYPQGVTIDSTNNRLFVADSGNSRVLVFETTAITDGENAVNVLGQTDFTSASYSANQSGMRYLNGVNFDSTNNRLFVADSSNNRVLVFDTTTIADGENAVNVLGQPDFFSNSTATTQSGMNYTNDLIYDAYQDQLFIVDADNNRVLIYDFNGITPANPTATQTSGSRINPITPLINQTLPGQSPIPGLTNNPANPRSSSGLPLIAPVEKFLRNLGFGSIGEDVRRLQKFLNMNEYTLAGSGAGAPNKETTYFGPRTRLAVIIFQETYAESILHPLGLTRGTGYFGNATRGFINALMR